MKKISGIMLCCIFNYSPKYRESIYKQIDNAFDTQFYFGREVEEGTKSGIEKLDQSIFKHKPKQIRNYKVYRSIQWRTGIWYLPLNPRYKKFLITGDLPLSYIPFLLLCRLFGKKVYAWGHGLKHHSRKLRFLEKFYQDNIDAFFIYGQQGRMRMGELGYPLEKYHVIYNSLNGGIDQSKHQSYSSDVYKNHFLNENPILIFIGRLTRNKCLNLLIEVLAELNKENFKCNLAIIGDGEERETLYSLASLLNVTDNIWFYGKCYDDSILSELIYNADLCVSPGNVGLTALHCMSYGVPVITHDNFETQMPEYEIVVPGLTGLLFKEGDKDDLKGKIKEWLNIADCKEIVRNHCYEMINGKWNSSSQIKVFNDVINS